MKQSRTKYTEESVTYFPCYEAGKLGIIATTILGILAIAVFLLVLFGNYTSETVLFVMIASPLVILMLVLMLVGLIHQMRMKIVVSTDGIELFHGGNTPQKQVAWEDVSGVYFHKDGWYGREVCRIFLKSTFSLCSAGSSKCDFILPLYGAVLENILLLIPRHLWKNDPKYILW